MSNWMLEGAEHLYPSNFVEQIPFTEETDSKKRLLSASASSILQRSRIIVFDHQFDNTSCHILCNQLMVLDQMKTEGGDLHADITVYLNSPGGQVHEGLRVVDTMYHIKSRVNIINNGMAASMGAYLLTQATGKRMMTPFARTMIHQVSSGAQGHVGDMQISMEQTIALNKLLMTNIAKRTNFKTLDKIMEIANRDAWFTAEECLENGIIDEITSPIWEWDAKKKEMILRDK